MSVANTTGMLYAGDRPLTALYAGAVKVWPPESQWPVGILTHWLGSTAPEGWAICDGSPHGSAELQTLLGSPNTPNLTDRFVRGAGATTVVGTGGATSVALTTTHMPAHDHDLGTQSANHTHTGNTASGGGSHTHTATSGTVSALHVHN